MDFLNVFEMILLSSLVGSVIVLMILTIKFTFRNKLTSTFHYYIWFILLIKLIIPVGPQNPINIYNIYENFYVQSSTNEITQINPSKQIETSDLGDTKSISASQPLNESVIVSTMNLTLKNKVNIESAFFFIWLFGILLFTGILIKGYRNLKYIVSSSIKNISITHKEILYKCMQTMNTRTEVQLSYSSKISSPSLCGLIKPKILIPVSVARNVSDEEFKYIIIHELTHLKNRDIFINWVITLLSIIYWFNPILLYGFYKMRQDCEFSCDNKAISYLNEGKNLHYGNAMIRVLELTGSSNRLMGTTSMVMNRSEIKRRIIMITKYKKVGIKNIILGTILVVIIGGMGIALNTSKSKVEIPVTIAEEFVRNIYTVDEKKVALFKTLVGQTPPGMSIIGEGVPEGSITGPNEEYTKITESLYANIQPLMTKGGYEGIMMNQFDSLSMKICANGNYTAQVTDFTLGENVYGENDDKVRYPYEAKLKFMAADGKGEIANMTKGAIELTKENGEWKVSMYTITVFPELHR